MEESTEFTRLLEENIVNDADEKPETSELNEDELKELNRINAFHEIQDNKQGGVKTTLVLKRMGSDVRAGLRNIGTELSNELENELFVWEEFHFAPPKSDFSDDPSQPIVDLDKLFRVRKFNF